MTADVETASGIAEAGVLATVTVGPNPAADMLTIALGQAAGRRVEYTLTDATGRALRTGVLTSDRTVLGTEGLVNGTYHLTLCSAELLKSIAVQVVR
ncbi:MAG: T9SS type A sorting domain-containing protein [Bacteroidetes bacterium]|nr:T9SS type A sorting domain-containing protein [Bacteroidota bacterium]